MVSQPPRLAELSDKELTTLFRHAVHHGTHDELVPILAERNERARKKAQADWQGEALRLSHALKRDR